MYSPSYHSNSINSCFSTLGRENEFHARCCSNIQCKHAHMHRPVCCQPSLLKQICATGEWLKLWGHRRWWRHHSTQGDVAFPYSANVQSAPPLKQPALLSCVCLPANIKPVWFIYQCFVSVAVYAAAQDRNAAYVHVTFHQICCLHYK